MTQRRFFLSVFIMAILCVSFWPGYAAAQDKSAVDSALAKLEKRSRELAETLDEDALKHLFHIRETFGSTRAVKVVRGDVQNAVKACGTANPDMKSAMDGRFSAWMASVDPVVKAKEKDIDAAIAAQTYMKPKEIKDYLKMIERAANNVDKDITKVPVTTSEACDGLLKSMDSTETVLTELIKGMELVPWPPVIEEKPVQKITVPNH